MKIKFFSITTMLVCVAVICFAIVADLTGKWVGSVKTPDGSDFQLTYVFKADGNTLTGSMQTPQGELPISEGKIDGANFSFKFDFGGTPIVNTGKFYGDSIGVDANINGMKYHTKFVRATN